MKRILFSLSIAAAAIIGLPLHGQTVVSATVTQPLAICFQCHPAYDDSGNLTCAKVQGFFYQYATINGVRHQEDAGQIEFDMVANSATSIPYTFGGTSKSITSGELIAALNAMIAGVQAGTLTGGTFTPPPSS